MCGREFDAVVAEGFCFGGERKGGGHSVVERLFSCNISCKEDVCAVGDGKRTHEIEPIEGFCPPFSVGFEEDFPIALRSKFFTQFFKLMF